MEAETRELRRAVDVVFGKVDGLGAKLDALTAPMHELRGSTGPALRDILSFVRDGAVLFSLVVAGILYLANATNGRSVSDLETRMAPRNHHRHGTVCSRHTSTRRRCHGSISILPSPALWLPPHLGLSRIAPNRVNVLP